MPLTLGEPFSFDQTLPTESLDLSGVQETHSHVVILGAGLAGLTCAYRYAQRLGHTPTTNELLVLEREAQVGGRVRSLKIGERVINLGAVTFQPTAYPSYMALLAELGLQDRVRIIPRRTMLFDVNGHSIHADNLSLARDGLGALVGRGVFTPTEALQLLRFYFYMRRVTSTSHFDELLALHERSVTEWARAFGFSASVIKKFVEPFIAFTFSAPENVSAAFGVLLLGFNLSRPANLVGGMMQVPEKLAERLQGIVETDAPALRVEREPGGFVTHYRKEGTLRRVHSKYLVLALPAKVAAGLVPDMRERAAHVRYGNGQAVLVRGNLKIRGDLRLGRVDRSSGVIIYGGEAQPDGEGAHYFNLLTYRGENALDDAAQHFREGRFEQIAAYRICPAVAAPEPNQTPLPLDWGDGLFMAGDCTSIFPSQEAAVSSGERVAGLIEI